MKLWNRLRYMKLINICHLLCFNCKMQGKMLTLRVFTALANQTVAVLLIPVFSPLWFETEITLIEFRKITIIGYFYISNSKGCQTKVKCITKLKSMS